MLIIWGFRSAVTLLGIVTLVCGSCRNPAAQRIEQVVRTFTLFWIPLFPISRKTHLTCAFCGVRTEVPKDQVDALVAAVPRAPQTPAQPARPGPSPNSPRH